MKSNQSEIEALDALCEKYFTTEEKYEARLLRGDCDPRALRIAMERYQREIEEMADGMSHEDLAAAQSYKRYIKA